MSTTAPTDSTLARARARRAGAGSTMLRGGRVALPVVFGGKLVF